MSLPGASAESRCRYSPPEKDIKHAGPKSYAELFRGATPENLAKRPAQPLPNGKQRSAQRGGSGDGVLWDSINSQEWNYDGRLATEQREDFGASPETVYWANTVVLMGARLKVEYTVSRWVRPHQCRRCCGLHRTERYKRSEVQALQWKRYQVCQLRRPACSKQPDVPDDGASCPESPQEAEAFSQGMTAVSALSMAEEIY
ncbi:hypothetical protein V8E54_005881 [Elaphomyces granulatus]